MNKQPFTIEDLHGIILLCAEPEQMTRVVWYGEDDCYEQELPEVCYNYDDVAVSIVDHLIDKRYELKYGAFKEELLDKINEHYGGDYSDYTFMQVAEDIQAWLPELLEKHDDGLMANIARCLRLL